MISVLSSNGHRNSAILGENIQDSMVLVQPFRRLPTIYGLIKIHFRKVLYKDFLSSLVEKLYTKWMHILLT